MENLSNLDELNVLKCKFFEIGVNCFMWPNVMNERFPTSLNQETLEASNLYHGLCKSSRNNSHIDLQVCDTAYLRILRLSGCTLSFNSLTSPLLKKS